MKNIFAAIVVLVLGIFAAVFIMKSKPKPEPQPAAEPAAPLVEVVKAEYGTYNLAINTQGTVKPLREIDLVAQVSGQIVATADNFAGGGFFEKADRLVQIEPADYQLALTRAEASVVQAEELLATEKARAIQAKREWRDLGSDAANDLFLRKPQQATARANLKAAKADRDEAQLRLQRTAVTAPFHGRVLEKHVDVGQYISAGTKVARIYSADTVEIRLPLTDKQLRLIDLSAIQPGSAQKPVVTLTGLYAGERYQWQGKLLRTEASIDINSRVTYLVAEVEHPFDTSRHPAPLNIGLFVNASIEGKPLNQVIRLPRAALQVDRSIIVVDEQQQLQFRNVDVLESNEDWVYLKTELAAGTPIVVSNLPTAAPGMRVTIEWQSDKQASTQP